MSKTTDGKKKAKKPLSAAAAAKRAHRTKLQAKIKLLKKDLEDAQVELKSMAAVAKVQSQVRREIKAKK